MISLAHSLGSQWLSRPEFELATCHFSPTPNHCTKGNPPTANLQDEKWLV